MTTARFKMCAFILLIVVASAIYLQPIYGCEIYRFVESKEPQALEGHAIKTISHQFVSLCWSDCVWLPECFSINVRQTSEGMFECELNNSSKKANQQKMVTREGWSYHEMTNVSVLNCNYSDGCKRKEDLGDGWRRYGDAAIKLFTESKSWSDARSHCQSLGGDLLSITSSHENDFVNEVFVMKLNLTDYREDYFGATSKIWKLRQPDPAVKLKGPPGDVSYKPVDGETALYFACRQGYAHIPDVYVNPEGFTISFWMKVLNDPVAGKWIHPLNLLNQPFSDLSSAPGQIVTFYYKSGSAHISCQVKDKAMSMTSQFVDTWTHFAISVNKSTPSESWPYIGNQDKTMPAGGAYPSITGKENLLLGLRNNDDISLKKMLTGYLKDIMVINKSLDKNEIKSIKFWNERAAWLGLYVHTGRLNWSDGTPVGQFMPFPNPAGIGRECVVIRSDGKWSHRLCNNGYPYICEKRLSD